MKARGFATKDAVSLLTLAVAVGRAAIALVTTSVALPLPPPLSSGLVAVIIIAIGPHANDTPSRAHRPHYKHDKDSPEASLPLHLPAKNANLLCWRARFEAQIVTI
jgi:hypothetical protein